MAGKCIKPECECLDYCEAEDPYGKPMFKAIKCDSGRGEHLKYHDAWLNGYLTDRGYVASITPIDNGSMFVEVKFK